MHKKRHPSGRREEFVRKLLYKQLHHKKILMIWQVPLNQMNSSINFIYSFLDEHRNYQQHQENYLY